MGTVLNPQIPKDFMTSYLTSSETLYGKANILYKIFRSCDRKVFFSIKRRVSSGVAGPSPDNVLQ